MTHCPDPLSPAALGIEAVTVIIMRASYGHADGVVEVPISIARVRFGDGAATPVKRAIMPAAAMRGRGRYSKHA